MKHIVEERAILMDQVSHFATGNAHRIETRDGEMQDVSEERLNIMLGKCATSRGLLTILTAAD